MAHLFCFLLILGASACVASVRGVRSLAATPEEAATWWKPALHTGWQWQLSGDTLVRFYQVGMYDIDLFDQSKKAVAALHSRGGKVVSLYECRVINTAR